MGICNLGGVKTGTAQEADVRGGKTFMNSTGVHTGTATNHGNVTLRPSGNESVRSGSGFYDSVTADGSQSYSKGVNDADARVNTSSASYYSGYTNGRNSAHLVTYKGLQDGGSIYAILEVDGQQKYKGNAANTNFTTYIGNTSINIQSSYVNGSIIAHLYINGTEVFNDNIPNIYHYGRSLIVYV